MKNTSKLFLAILVFTFSSLSSAAPLSAKRGANESADLYLQTPASQAPYQSRFFEINAEAARTSLHHLNVSAVPTWKESITLQEVFNQIRDKRFLNDRYHSGFLRRVSWLFPDDGCHVRAEISAQLLVNSKYQPPAKIFIFGDLRARTENNPNGFVSWWFHVADAYRVGNEIMVLDPSLDIEHPVSLHEWIALSGNPGNLSVSICSAGTYMPTDHCHAPPAASGNLAFSEQQEFLIEEWTRMRELGRNPHEVLGDNPPWKAK